MNISLSAFAPDNLVSRDGFGSPVPRQPDHLHTQAEFGVYLGYSSRVLRRRPFTYLKPPYAIGPVPSLLGHAIAYRWRSLPRVRRHRASKSQVTSNECCLGGRHGPIYMRLSFPLCLDDANKWRMVRVQYKRVLNGLSGIVLFLVSGKERVSWVFFHRGGCVRNTKYWGQGLESRRRRRHGGTKRITTS